MMMTSSRGLSSSFVFHASVTQQRSSGSKTRISCSHVHERTNSCPPLQTRVREKGKPHKLVLKARRTLETRLIVQQCAQQHILPTMFACRPKRGKTQLLKSRQRNQGYQKTWSAQRIQTISKHASRPLLQNMTVDCSYGS